MAVADPAVALVMADLALVAGVILAALALPAAISARIDRQSPRLATALCVLATGLILVAAYLHPGDYTWREVPLAFIRVTALIVN